VKHGLSHSRIQDFDMIFETEAAEENTVYGCITQDRGWKKTAY
jgi:hypothetical protein